MNPLQDSVNGTALLCDREVAEQLSVSRSWVRKQRFDRRHGSPHVFDIDPVMIGGLPRYPREEVLTWIEHRKNSRIGGKIQ